MLIVLNLPAKITFIKFGTSLQVMWNVMKCLQASVVSTYFSAASAPVSAAGWPSVGRGSVVVQDCPSTKMSTQGMGLRWVSKYPWNSSGIGRDSWTYIDPFSFLVDSSNSKDSSGLWDFSEWNSFMSRCLANPGSRHDLLSFMSPFTSQSLRRNRSWRRHWCESS